MIMAKLFYIIGSSGAGKDSLINYLKDKLPHNSAVVFAHRYITRLAGAGNENHIELSKQEFLHRKQFNCFAMDWFSHDLFYGIGVEINFWLNNDLNVVVNGSRGFLNQAKQYYPSLVPILIDVDDNTLRQRLISRGREPADQIEKRLLQANKLKKTIQHTNLIKITNNNLLSSAGEQLLRVILSQVKQ